MTRGICLHTKPLLKRVYSRRKEFDFLLSWSFLMTDSICHSSFPRTVLEKVTLTIIQFRIYPRTKVDPMFQCVYISTPLKSCPYKSSATNCAWSMARVAEKTRLNICANNKGADQRPRRLISAFVVRYSSFFSTKKRLTNLNGEQNDTGNLLVSHRICHFRAIHPFDLEGKKTFWQITSHENVLTHILYMGIKYDATKLKLKTHWQFKIKEN